MFEKISDEKYDNRFVKIYKSSDSYDVLMIIEELQKNNIGVSNVYISENSDLGMKVFEGNYSFEDFLIKYNEIEKGDISNITFDLDNGCRLYAGGGNYISLSSVTDVELNDLFNKKKYFR